MMATLNTPACRCTEISMNYGTSAMTYDSER